MARKSKCKECGKELEKEERYVFSNKSYCKECYDKKIEVKKSYDTLIDTIINYYEVNVIDGLILKQIKEYKEKYNYTYAGMTYTLWYCKEILNKKFERRWGIAIVKFEYNNAETYFINQQRIQQSLSSVKEPKINNVNINLNKVFKKNNKKHLINLNDVIGGNKDGI